MDVFSLIDRLDSHEPVPFLAPVLDASKVLVHVIQDGIPYSFAVSELPGWWVLKPTSKTKAQRIGPPASMLDVMDYLRILPRFLVIALFRLRSSTWLVVPFNNADAEQRGWSNGEPRQLHLARHRVQPFDVLEARRLGNELIYHLRSCAYGHSNDTRLMRDSLLNPSPSISITADIPGMKTAWDILREHIREQKKQARLQAETDRKPSIEEQLRYHLAFMGAELSSWYESGEGYRVGWTHQGQSYDMDIARSGFIESAGVCLDGTSMRHNLSAIVSVMAEHRRLGRTY